MGCSTKLRCFPNGGIGTKVVPILWMGCCPNVCTHLVDGVWYCVFPILQMLVLKLCFPSCGWGVVPSCGVSPMGVLVQKWFPSCGWGVVPRVMFPIQWMGCCPNVCSHLVDGVFGTKCLFPISDLVDGV